MAIRDSKVKKHATHEDANLLLRLYDIRREERMRKARDWFAKDFHVSTVEGFQKLCPIGSEENASFRMVVSYWDMAARLSLAVCCTKSYLCRTPASCSSCGNGFDPSYRSCAKRSKAKLSVRTWKQLRKRWRNIGFPILRLGSNEPALI
jgi:hypothetical protein